ncbi:hypothetical protein GCM10027347_59470 [Larkinella harenae]
MQSKNKPGRPKGSGRYGVETKPMRVPVILWDKVRKYIAREVKKAKQTS